MHNQSSDPESIEQYSISDTGANSDEATGNHGSAFHQPISMEDARIEALAKKALDETIREGGAFARENPDQFKA